MWDYYVFSFTFSMHSKLLWSVNRSIIIWILFIVTFIIIVWVVSQIIKDKCIWLSLQKSGVNLVCFNYYKYVTIMFNLFNLSLLKCLIISYVHNITNYYLLQLVMSQWWLYLIFILQSDIRYILLLLLFN